MISSFYYHGADTLATELTAAQIRAARLDAAGSLWVDLQAPTAEESAEFLIEAFQFDPMTLTSWDCGLPVSGLSIDGAGILITTTMPTNGEGSGRSNYAQESTCLGIHLASNSLVTVHQQQIPAVDAVQATATRDVSLIAAGADRLAAELLLQSAGAHLAQSDVMRDRLEDIERRALGRSWSSGLPKLHILQGELARLRQEASAQAEIALGLADAPAPHVREANRVYFRAAYQQLVAAVNRATTLEERADRLVTMQLPLAATRLQSAIRWLALIVAMLLAVVLVGLYFLVAYGSG